MCRRKLRSRSFRQGSQDLRSSATQNEDFIFFSRSLNGLLFLRGFAKPRRNNKPLSEREKNMKSSFCVAEDRKSCEPCLKLLLLSLRRHIPDTSVSLFYPPATGQFIDWMKKCPQVQLQAKPLKNGYGWNVKPQAIMHLL